MNFKQKLTYMALGCLFTLIGYTLATLNTNVTAQSEPTVVDEIVCRKLRVVDSEDRTVLALESSVHGGIFTIYNPLGPKVVEIYPKTYAGDAFTVYSADGNRILEIGRDSNGGYIGVNHRSGQRAATMAIDDKHKEGFIGVEAKDGKGTIQLYTNENGGYIWMTDQQKKSKIQLQFNKDGGLAIFNKGGENVLQASVGYRGGGVIHTRDKHGYRTGHLP